MALADALGVAVAQLAIGPRGLHVERFVDVGDADLPPEYASADPQAVAAALDGVLTTHRLSRNLLALGLDDSLTGASLAELPDVRGRALTALLGQKVRQELPVQQKPVLADLLRVEPRGENGAEARQRAWVTWSEQELVAGLAGALAARQIRVERVLPPALALLDMLGRTREGATPGLELVVRFCWPSVVIGVFSGGSPQYARFLGDLLVDATEDPVSAGITELRRTVAFVRERNRGKQPDVVWHTGLEPSRALDFAQRTEADLGLRAAPLSVAATGDLDGGRADRLVVLAALLHHGTGRRRRRGEMLDLLPDRPRRDHWLLAGLGAAVLATTAVSMEVLDHIQQSSLDVMARRAALTAEHSRLSLIGEERAALARDLEEREVWQAALESAPWRQTDPAAPLAEAILTLPDGVRLEDARVARPYGEGGTLDLRLSCDSTGSGADELSRYLELLAGRTWAADLATRRGDLAFDGGRDGASERLDLEITLR